MNLSGGVPDEGPPLALVAAAISRKKVEAVDKPRRSVFRRGPEDSAGAVHEGPAAGEDGRQSEVGGGRGSGVSEGAIYRLVGVRVAPKNYEALFFFFLFPPRLRTCRTSYPNTYEN